MKKVFAVLLIAAALPAADAAARPLDARQWQKVTANNGWVRERDASKSRKAMLENVKLARGERWYTGNRAMDAARASHGWIAGGKTSAEEKRRAMIHAVRVQNGWYETEEKARRADNWDRAHAGR